MFRTLPANLTIGLSNVGATGRVVLAGTTTLLGAATANNGESVVAGPLTAVGTTAVNAGSLTLSGNGTLNGVTGLTLANTARLTLDNTAVNNANRLPDAAPITLNGATLNFLGNAAGSAETLGTVTLNSNTSTARSVTAGTGTNVLTAANLVRAGTARGTFVGVNTDLGTAANQVKFTGRANNLTLPYATVVGGNGTQAAVNTTARGVRGVPSVTQATVLKGSLAEVAAPTDVVRLTRSEVINTAITVAGLEFAGDGQFTRLRDGDRFWYENTFAGTQLQQLRATSLADVLRRNTVVTTAQKNAFVFRAEVSETAFGDPNRNGRRDSGEPGLAGGTIEVIDTDTGEVVATATTDANGRYRIGVADGLRTGRYQVVQVLPPGATETTPARVVSIAGPDGLFGGRATSRQVFRPIAALSATASHISATNLSARIDPAVLAAELVDLGRVLNEAFDRLVAEAAAQLGAMAGEKNVAIAVDVHPARVVGDATALTQAANNLLTNAIKYNRPGGEVRVGAKRCHVTLTVADTGEGIPAADQPHLFERFYRVDKARSRAAGGTGLGLAICKSIVEAHGGTIGVESVPGKGTTFSVRLPRAPTVE